MARLISWGIYHLRMDVAAARHYRLSGRSSVPATMRRPSLNGRSNDLQSDLSSRRVDRWKDRVTINCEARGYRRDFVDQEKIFVLATASQNQ